MTVTISPAAPAPVKAAEGATPPAGDGAKFDAMMGSTEQPDAGVQAPVAPPPVGDEALGQCVLPDQALEAILQSLRTALLPGGALPGKAGKVTDATKTDEKAADDRKDDPAATLLANLILAPPPAAPAVSKAGPTRGLDDVSAKTDARSPLPTADLGALAAMATPPPLPADLMALTDTASMQTVAQPDRAAASLDRLVDTARDAAWLDRLSRDIAESAGAGDRVRFRMLPPSLGALDVSVERHAAGLNVSMTTHSADARNLIADARQQMVDSLKAQGVPLIQLSLANAGEDQAGHRPPTFFNHLVEVAAPTGTELAAKPDETAAERMGRFA